MSLKKALTNPVFLRDDDGRMIAYLYGRNGYFVPDEATEARLRTIRLWLVISAFLPAIIGLPIMLWSYGQIYKWPLAAWVIAVAGTTLPDVAQRAVVRRVTQGLVPAGRIGFGEAFARVRKAVPRLWRWYMWYLIIAAPLVFLGSAVYLAAGTWMVGYCLALAGVAFSICMMAGGIYGLRLRSRS
jgi:hypothetical protein